MINASKYLNENDRPERKTWRMIRKAPVVLKNLFMTKDNKKFMTVDGHEFLVKENEEPIIPAPQYIMHEAAAIWSGEYGLNENNEWVDRINNYTFTPINASKVPLYDSANKLLNINDFGGMQSSLSLPATSEVPYTLELVVRDMDEAETSARDNWGKLIGPEMNNWNNKSKSFGLSTFWNNYNNNAYAVTYRSSIDIHHYTTSKREHGLTTLTVVPTLGIWVNGEKEVDFNLDCAEIIFALGSGVGSYNYTYASQTKFKVHGVRYYPMELTDEQIKNNYEVDKITYGE